MSIPKLQDHSRNFVYEWFLPQVKPCKVLDIGSRDSGLPAYMASLGFDVTACERDVQFLNSQREWAKSFGSNPQLVMDELEEIYDKFDLILDIFSLQHNAYADKDIACYEHCAKILSPGGRIFIAHEYRHANHGGVGVQKGRGDGDMVVYSDKEIAQRLIEPIASLHDITASQVKYMMWTPQTVKWCDALDARAACIKIVG